MTLSEQRRREDTAVLASLIVSILLIVLTVLGVWLMDISKLRSDASARNLLF